MLGVAEREAMAALWTRKLAQDAAGLPQAARHRNLKPESAEVIHALAVGLGARRLLEVGGSSGLSTVALAAAARATGGMLPSIEIEPVRQAESRARVDALGLSAFVRFILADAADVLPSLGPMEFVLLDCEKDDYIRFFDLLERPAGALVVADNILSHHLGEYVRHVRRVAPSMTLAIGKGLELTGGVSQ